MKTHIHLFLVFALVFICSCSDKNSDEMPQPNINPIYFNFTLKGSSYHIPNTDYTFRSDGYSMKCSQEWVRGLIDLVLEDPKEENFIESVSFSLTKKVFKNELDPSDDMSYLSKILNANTFGFPISTNGYYEVYDLEKSIYIVNMDVSAEAFLEIKTKDNFYRSSSVVPNERIDKSFITIEKVVKNESEDKTLYPYFVEGTFKVNLFEGMYGATSEVVEGNFRWPVYNIKDSELLTLCN